MNKSEITILVIEDAEALRKDICEMLTFEGYKTIQAGDGIKGLEAAHEYYPNLILCDIMMPEMDGITMLEQVRKEARLSLIPFIFLTGKGDRSDVYMGLKLGADDYISKPFTAEDLALRIEVVLERHTYLTRVTQLITLDINHHVFLSYSRQDYEMMRRVTNGLKAHGLEIWVDTDAVEPGTKSWKKAVQEAIDRAGCIVVILSPNAKHSQWIEAELDYAEAQNKTVFPVLARGDKSNAVPFGYTLSQWIDITQGDFDSEMQKLVGAIRKKLNLL